MGSVRTRADIPRYAQMLQRGQLHTAPLITASLPLKDINEAIRHARTRQGARTKITF